jgi:hypothetical protein
MFARFPFLLHHDNCSWPLTYNRTHLGRQPSHNHQGHVLPAFYYDLDDTDINGTGLAVIAWLQIPCEPHSLQTVKTHPLQAMMITATTSIYTDRGT